MTKSDVAAIMIISCIASIVVVGLLSGCDDKSDPAGFGQKVQAQEGDGLIYWFITVEGMPCIYVKDRNGNAGFAGLTCDWSQRKH